MPVQKDHLHSMPIWYKFTQSCSENAERLILYSWLWISLAMQQARAPCHLLWWICKKHDSVLLLSQGVSRVLLGRRSRPQPRIPDCRTVIQVLRRTHRDGGEEGTTVTCCIIAGANLSHGDTASLSPVKSPAITTNRVQCCNYGLTPAKHQAKRKNCYLKLIST